MSIAQFQEFFDHCVGQWTTERTYHYLTHRDVERSHTEFVIHPLDNEAKAKVLEDNQRLSTNLELQILPGYRLAFQTVSEKGDHLRDKAYEEAKPMVAHFRYDIQTRELLMTTTYTRVVSVDSITLINPELRIRRIINYQRPIDNQPLDTVLLVGFGVEQKQ
jgi:CpeS-like protein